MGSKDACKFVFILLIALLCVVAETTASGQGKIGNGKIAFVRTEGNVSSIWVMNPDGTNQVNLTPSGWTDQVPTWSPDGKKLAFLTGDFGDVSIYTMNADGSDRRELAVMNNGVFNDGLSWSPDGSKIAIVDTSGLYVINSDGTNRVPLLEQGVILSPSWAPDSSRILFTWLDGNPHLYSVNPDGSDLQYLPGDCTPETGCLWPFGPAWSPSGAQIMFSVNYWDFNFVLFTANPDGTDRRYFHGCFGPWGNDGCKAPTLDAIEPAFSPDGRMVVFTMSDYFYGDQQIFVKNIDRTGLTFLADGHDPAWQPIVSKSTTPRRRR